jgi:hypothetical protein
VCRIFISMNEEDSKDEYELEKMRGLGFTDVDWEDKGAHGTIFDDFDTLEHFKQVAEFRDEMAVDLPGGADAASELIMVLEDLNPQLFNVLGSAVAALRRARHEEDVAQAALSGRRYLEKLADVLFASREGEYRGRKVGREQYRNRIWAFVYDNVPHEPKRVTTLGQRVDRLVEEFNAGLHADAVKERVRRAFVDVASLTVELLALNPAETRKPYYAYEARLMEFFREVLKPIE